LMGRYNVPLPPPEEEEEEPATIPPLEVLEEGKHYVIVNKPPSVVVHHSSWTSTTKGRRNSPQQRRGGQEMETPMLQRVRDAMGGRRVNLIHRLDRGASGCLVLAFAQNETGKKNGGKSCEVTSSLIRAVRSPTSTKTYIALCDGDGIWNGVDYRKKGWFTLDLPVKDEWGKVIEDCSTEIRFVAGNTIDTEANTNNNTTEGTKLSIILARLTTTGRWHQIRQHLASGTLGHAILGDSTHGRSRTNRIWRERERRGSESGDDARFGGGGGLLPKQRTCLHLARLTIPPLSEGGKSENHLLQLPNEGVDVSCPLPNDMTEILNCMTKGVLEDALVVLREEGIIIDNVV